ncbi:hypothetical protein EsH8_V_000945 [Colletotrichum jinshuiense]
MGAHSQESAYNGHSASKSSHKHSTKESKKQLAKRRASMYNGQAPSEEPSAYLASFQTVHTTGSERRARVEAEMKRTMSKFNGN